MTPDSLISSQRSLPSRVRSPTPANTENPPCCFATLLISSMMTTVLPTPAPPKRPIFLHFENDVDGGRDSKAVTDDTEGLIDGRHGRFGELDVHGGAGDLDDVPDIF